MRRAALLWVVGAMIASSCTVIDVTVLSHDALGGRDNGSPGSQVAQDYLIAVTSLFADGVDDSVKGDDSYRQQIPGGTNILAVIPGTDLADEYVMIGAHYDHLGSSCRSIEAGDTICNGATDNATGVAAVLGLGRAFAAPGNGPRRSVILAFWDREEDGLLGANHYINHPLVPLENTVAYINFDIQGANLLPSLREISFAVGAETGGSDFVDAVQQAVDSQPLQTKLVSSVFGQNRSDYAEFIGAGIPTVFFGDSTGPCYHTTGDEVDIVDFAKLEEQIAIGRNLAGQLASGSITPVFDPATPVATYHDAVALEQVVALALADLDRFDAADQAIITGFATDLAAIVAAGEAAFGGTEIAMILGGAAQTVSLLTSGDCSGFLAGEFDALTYNVAGLPAVLSGSSPDVNTEIIAPLLNDFDLVLLQESWKTPEPNTLDPLRVYHEIIEAGSTHSFMSVPLPQPVGTDPFRPTAQLSDGLNRLTNFASTPVARTAWTECFGIVDSGADCLALKGFSHSIVEVAPGISIDVYNLHAEAGGSIENEILRQQDMDELGAYILANSAGRPLIVGGDFNLEPDDVSEGPIFASLLSATGLVDACTTLGCPDVGRIDRFLYRSSAELTIDPLSWQFETATFVDGGGEPLSDHDPLHVRFAWNVPE